MPEEWVSILGRAGRDGLECQALGKIRVEGLREEEDAIGASEFGRLRGEPLATATERGGLHAPEIQSNTTAVGPAQTSGSTPASDIARCPPTVCRGFGNPLRIITPMEPMRSGTRGQRGA